MCDHVQYLVSMCAERIKARDASSTTSRALEVYIPLISITVLLGVTVWIMHEAVGIIMMSAAGREKQQQADVSMMLGFAAGNLVVDIISVWLFYIKRRTVFQHSAVLSSADDDQESGVPPPPALLNLNMLAAFTHVGSDTLRTASVLVAATVASVFKQSSSLCDAWAAMVVSGTIWLTVLPLVREVHRSWTHDRAAAGAVQEIEGQPPNASASVSTCSPLITSSNV